MGWMGPDEHEGWVAMVYADGAVSSGTSTSGGHYLDGYTYLPRDDSDTRTWGVIDPAFLRPNSDTVAWVMRCECGWQGDPVAVTGSDPKWNEPSEDEEERLLLPAWRKHIAPFRAVEELADLADEYRAISDRIADAVASARSNGASWSEIGRTLGMTKQGAQQRWGG